MTANQRLHAVAWQTGLGRQPAEITALSGYAGGTEARDVARGSHGLCSSR